MRWRRDTSRVSCIHCVHEQSRILEHFSDIERKKEVAKSNTCTCIMLCVYSAFV